MKIETKENFLILDFDNGSPSAYPVLVAMVEILNSKKLIDSYTIIKVRGLNLSLFTKLMVDLCNKLGYIFRVCSLMDTDGRYIVQATHNPDYPVNSVIE